MPSTEALNPVGRSILPDTEKGEQTVILRRSADRDPQAVAASLDAGAVPDDQLFIDEPVIDRIGIIELHKQEIGLARVNLLH